jgi:hypothetical protein
MLNRAMSSRSDGVQVNGIQRNSSQRKGSLGEASPVVGTLSSVSILTPEPVAPRKLASDKLSAVVVGEWRVTRGARAGSHS